MREENFMNSLLQHFSLQEFNCKCGKCNKGFSDMDPEFLKMLSRARVIANVPFQITSAMRCGQHNFETGGTPGSEHIDGQAVDIACNDSVSRHEIIMGAFTAGFSRIGIGKTFVHLGNGPNKPQNVIWLY